MKKHNAARGLGEQEAHFFDYDDLCKLVGKQRNTVYKHVERGAFDPDDLRSVVLWVARHATLDLKRQILDYALDPGASSNPALAGKKRAKRKSG